MDEKKVRKRKPRVGVYVCHCGGNISDYVDVEEVAKQLGNEANVIVAKDLMFDCSDASQSEMIEDIRTQKLDRIVVAACSPKLHELTFRGTAKRAGLNPYMFYHANIREQASWAHENDRNGATAKALAHTRAALAYVSLAEPLENPKIESTRAVLVIGGGVAGVKAALDLAGMDIQVILVERSSSLGGHVSQLDEVYPYGKEGSDVVKQLVEDLRGRSNVTIFTSAVVESCTGYVGRFDVKIRIHPRYVTSSSTKFGEAIEACPVEIPDEYQYGMVRRKAIFWPIGRSVPDLPVIDMQQCTTCGECVRICGSAAIDLDQKEEEVAVRVGSVVVATGFDSYEPEKGEYGYGTVKGVVTLPELEVLQRLSVGGELEYQGKKIRGIALIYCVGSRQKEDAAAPKAESGKRPTKTNKYCSRYCCNAAINDSLVLNRKFRGLTTYHLYRDIRTYGKNELMYEEASKAGSIFIRFDEDDPPAVTERNGMCSVTVKSPLIGNQPIELTVDLVVLVTGMVPRANKELNNLLALPIGSDGFYREIHQKLRPVETDIGGLLIAGTSQGPKDIRETLSSASAASAKAAAFALKKELELEPFVASVNPDVCELSQACIRECPYEAIEIRDDSGGTKAWVNVAKCKGCGACVAVCPTEAIQVKGFTNAQVRTMIEALAK